MSGVEIRVRSNSTQARSDLAKLERSVAGLEKSANAVSNAFKNIVIGAVSFAAINKFSKSIIAAGDNMTNLENRIALVTGRTAELGRTMTELSRISSITRVSLSTSTETFSRFGLALKGTGVSSKELLKVTKTINQAISISGASAQSAQAAIIQLGQGLASGQLRGQELNSVLEQTPRIAQAIADGMGIPFGKLRKAAEDGKLETQAILKAIIQEAPKIAKEFGLINKTVENTSIVLRNQLMKSFSIVSREFGVNNTIIRALEKIIDRVKWFNDNISWYLYLAKVSIGEFKFFVNSIVSPISKAFSNIFSGNFDADVAIKSLKDGFAKIQAAIDSNEVIASLKNTFTEMAEIFSLSSIAASYAKGEAALRTFFSNISKLFEGKGEGSVEAIKEKFNSLKGVFSLDFLSNTFERATAGISGFIAKIQDLYSTLFGEQKKAADKSKTTSQSLIQKAAFISPVASLNTGANEDTQSQFTDLFGKIQQKALDWAAILVAMFNQVSDQVIAFKNNIINAFGDDSENPSTINGVFATTKGLIWDLVNGSLSLSNGFEKASTTFNNWKSSLTDFVNSEEKFRSVSDGIATAWGNSFGPEAAQKLKGVLDGVTEEFFGVEKTIFDINGQIDTINKKGILTEAGEFVDENKIALAAGGIAAAVAGIFPETTAAVLMTTFRLLGIASGIALVSFLTKAFQKGFPIALAITAIKFLPDTNEGFQKLEDSVKNASEYIRKKLLGQDTKELEGQAESQGTEAAIKIVDKLLKSFQAIGSGLVEGILGIEFQGKFLEALAGAIAFSVGLLAIGVSMPFKVLKSLGVFILKEIFTIDSKPGSPAVLALTTTIKNVAKAALKGLARGLFAGEAVNLGLDLFGVDEDISKGIGDIVGGAVTGATAGSAIPIVGTIMGAIIGGIVGGLLSPEVRAGISDFADYLYDKVKYIFDLLFAKTPEEQYNKSLSIVQSETKAIERNLSRMEGLQKSLDRMKERVVNEALPEGTRLLAQKEVERLEGQISLYTKSNSDSQLLIDENTRILTELYGTFDASNGTMKQLGTSTLDLNASTRLNTEKTEKLTSALDSTGEYLRSLNNIPPMSGVNPINQATGGFIYGPGGPRDDKIPAMLSNGESVINAASTAKYKDLIAAINADRLPGFKDGVVDLAATIGSGIYASSSNKTVGEILADVSLTDVNTIKDQSASIFPEMTPLLDRKIISTDTGLLSDVESITGANPITNPSGLVDYLAARGLMSTGYSAYKTQGGIKGLLSWVGEKVGLDFPSWPKSFADWPNYISSTLDFANDFIGYFGQKKVDSWKPYTTALQQQLASMDPPGQQAWFRDSFLKGLPYFPEGSLYGSLIGGAYGAAGGILGIGKGLGKALLSIVGRNPKGVLQGLGSAASGVGKSLLLGGVVGTAIKASLGGLIGGSIWTFDNMLRNIPEKDKPKGPIGRAFANGGFVSGPGGPKDDKIFAMLSNGESVINAASTAKYAGLIKAINEDTLNFHGEGLTPTNASGNGFKIVGANIDAVEITQRIKELDDRLAILNGRFKVTQEQIGNNISDISTLTTVFGKSSEIADEISNKTAERNRLEKELNEVLKSGNKVRTTKKVDPYALTKAEKENAEGRAKEFVNTFSQGLSQALKTGNLKEFGKTILNKFTESIIDSLAEGITNQLFKGLIDKDGKGILANFFGSFTKLGKKSTGEALGKTPIKDSVKNVAKESSSIFSTMTTSLKDVFSGLGSTLSSLFKNLKGGIGDLISGISSLFSGGSSFNIGNLFSSFGNVLFGGSGLGSFSGIHTGGVIQKRLAGGVVNPGIGQAGKDSVPVMLTPGEYVLPSQRAAELFKSQGNKSNQQQVFNINVSGDVSRQTRKEIVKMIPQITSGVNMTNKENNYRSR